MSVIRYSILSPVTVLLGTLMLTACGGSETSTPAPSATSSQQTQQSAITQSVMTEGAEIIEQAQQQV